MHIGPVFQTVLCNGRGFYRKFRLGLKIAVGTIGRIVIESGCLKSDESANDHLKLGSRRCYSKAEDKKGGRAKENGFHEQTFESDSNAENIMRVRFRLGRSHPRA